MLDKSVGLPSPTLAEIGDFCLEVTDEEQKESSWDRNVYRMHVQKTGLNNPHSKS